MWPWRRRSERTVQRAAADAVPGPAPARPTGAASPQSAGAADRSGPPAAWQGLPPIQRVTPAEPRLNLPETFTGTLAAWRNPSYLAPLGHLVGAAEPSGVLHDAAPPAPEPRGAHPEPGLNADAGTPLPLAGAPAEGGRAGTPVQRQVGELPAPGVPSAGTGAAVPAGPVPGGRPSVAAAPPVALDPLPVSRLVTAPPPAVALHLPTVDPPVRAAGQPDEAAAGPAEPADPPAAPTLGLDLPPAGGDGPGAGGSVTGAPAPAATGPADLPVQRLAGEAARPHRRLGLGEPIVTPLPRPAATGPVDAPTAQRAPGGPAAGHRPPVPLDAEVAGPRPPGDPAAPVTPRPAGDTALPLAQRTPGESAAPVAQRTPGDTALPVAQPAPAASTSPALGGPPAGPGDPIGATGSEATVTDAPSGATLAGGAVETGDEVGAESATGPADQLAGLVGDTTVARLPSDAPTGPGPQTGPPATGELPVAGTAPGRATPSGDAADPPPATPPATGVPVHTYLPPDTGTPTVRIAPLLAAPTGTGPGDTGGGPAGGGAGAAGDGAGADRAGGPATPRDLPATGLDLPVVARLASPGAAARDAWAGSAAGEPATSGGTTPPAGHDATAPPGPDGAEPATAALIGGYADATGAPGDLPGGGQPPAPAALPVVARLVGDRPLRPLTRPVPELGGPAAPPPVQRVSWRHDSGAASAAVPTPPPLDGPAPALDDLPAVAAQPGATGPLGTGASHGPPTVQRWVGALTGTAPSAGGAAFLGGGGFAAAYPGGSDPSATPPGGPADLARPDLGGWAVQRAEPVEAASEPAAAPAAAAAGGHPPAAAAATEPEELLKKLYDPLLRRLKTELRLDRERHGVLGGPG